MCLCSCLFRLSFGVMLLFGVVVVILGLLMLLLLLLIGDLCGTLRCVLCVVGLVLVLVFASGFGGWCGSGVCCWWHLW